MSGRHIAKIYTDSGEDIIGNAIKLTALAHGGGCGCKLSPGVLREILADMPNMQAFPGLLVGMETGDDAAVYKINDEQAVIATTDFFMPIVDDPFDFGRIAATNALSDIYAMGGTPIMALAILGMPLGKLEPDVVRRILDGGAAICREAGIPISGGHSIDAPEPIYGLAAIGLVHPDRLTRNSEARAGDALLLSKPLGVGIISAALKGERLEARLAEHALARMIDTTTRLNRVGAKLAAIPAVHAMTDVTGFGLLGHGLEMCRPASLSARIDMAKVPVMDGVADLARQGCRTGAAVRNWESYGSDVEVSNGIAEWQRDLACDPQTSGGLLVAVEADHADEVLNLMREDGFVHSARIGGFEDGPGRICLE